MAYSTWKDSVWHTYWDFDCYESKYEQVFVMQYANGDHQKFGVPMRTNRITYADAVVQMHTWNTLWNMFPNCSDEEIDELSDYFDKWGEDVYMHYVQVI